MKNPEDDHTLMYLNGVEMKASSVHRNAKHLMGDYDKNPKIDYQHWSKEKDYFPKRKKKNKQKIFR